MGPSSLRVLLGRGDGTFTTGQTLPLLAFQELALVIADLDGDGTLDLLVTGLTPSRIVYTGPALGLAQGRGDGTFEQLLLFNAFERRPVAADFNQDGRQDLLLADNQTLNLMPGR